MSRFKRLTPFIVSLLPPKIQREPNATTIRRVEAAKLKY